MSLSIGKTLNAKDKKWNGAKLRDLRGDSTMSRIASDLKADYPWLSNVSSTHVAQWEKSSEPKRRTWEALSEYFGVSADEFWMEV